MNVQQELEILRGRPIEMRPPIDQIPCNEASDADALCRHPLVSVHMVTYNHEPYIRRAIESVLEQETDFEFEIVIGEDCSKDKTREICFEYQRRYPDKVRVLWSDENVFRIGGNIARVSARCRGEYIAILEGDDCWIDRNKLQKQVTVMRQHPTVGMCIGGGVNHNVVTGESFDWENVLFDLGVNRGRDFLRKITLESWRVRRGLAVLTASVMLRRSALEEARRSFDICRWCLVTQDTLCWAKVSSVSDVYYLSDSIAQYNVVPGSASSNPTLNLEADSVAIKIYFARMVLGVTWANVPYEHRYLFVRSLILKGKEYSGDLQRAFYKDLMQNREMKALGRLPQFGLVLFALHCGVLRGRLASMALRLNGYAIKTIGLLRKG